MRSLIQYKNPFLLISHPTQVTLASKREHLCYTSYSKKHSLTLTSTVITEEERTNVKAVMLIFSMQISSQSFAFSCFFASPLEFMQMTTSITVKEAHLHSSFLSVCLSHRNDCHHNLWQDNKVLCVLLLNRPLIILWIYITNYLTQIPRRQTTVIFITT